jgi:hypothetical protein
LVTVTVDYGDCATFTILALLVALLTLHVLGPPGDARQWVLNPAHVRVEDAIAEGEAAVGKPGIPLAKWRHVVTAPPGVPAVREVVVVTPYYRVAREAYLRALRGERLTPTEARALLDRLVKEHGPFPLGLLLRFSPPPSVLPHPRSISVLDASGRKLPITGFLRPQADPYEEVELVVDARKADLRKLTITVPVEPLQRIEIDLRGVR